MAQNPQTGVARLFDKGGNLLSERQLTPTERAWKVKDPKAEKYKSTSPYAYVANNPMRNIDPDGKDIIVLNNPKGAGGYGHTAILVNNSKGGWTFISKEGRNKEPWYSNEATGGPASAPYMEDFVSLETFREKQQTDDNLIGYTEDVRFATTKQEDKKAAEASTNTANSWYTFWGSNCADAVSDGLKAAGLDPGSKVKALNGIMSPMPNDRFKKMKENNKDRIIPTDSSEKKEQKNDNVNLFLLINHWLSVNPNIKINVQN